MTEDFQKNLLKVLDYYYKQEQKLQKKMDEVAQRMNDVLLRNSPRIADLLVFH